MGRIKGKTSFWCARNSSSKASRSPAANRSSNSICHSLYLLTDFGDGGYSLFCTAFPKARPVSKPSCRGTEVAAHRFLHPSMLNSPPLRFLEWTALLLQICAFRYDSFKCL